MLPNKKTHLSALALGVYSSLQGLKIDPAQAMSFDWSNVDWTGILIAMIASALRSGIAKIQKQVTL